jgi:competence protein ComEC
MILPSVTGKLIHLAICIALFMAACESGFFALVWVLDLIYLYRRERRLFWIGCLVISGMSLRWIWLNRTLAQMDDTEMVVTIVENYPMYLIGENKQGKYRLYFEDLPNEKPGSVLTVKGRAFLPEIRENPHNADSQGILKANGIHAFFQVASYERIKSGFHLGIISYMAKQYVINHFHPETTPWILLMVFGDDSFMDSEDFAQMNHLGIRHLFAISGMHIGLIVLFLDRLFQTLYCRKKTHHLLIGLFLLCYNLMTGFMVSIFRASLQTVVFFFINEKRHRFSRLDVLSLVFVGMLLWNPYFSRLLGFQLSFLISFCLLLARPLLNHPRKIVSLVNLTVIANLFAFPILLEANKGFGVLTIISNLIFVELVAVILLPGSFLTVFFPFLEVFFRMIVTGFSQVVDWMYSVDLWIDFNYPKFWMKGCHWGLAIALLFLSKTPKRRILTVELWLLLVFVACFPVPGTTHVTMLAVGTGDAIVITKGETTILIDTGPKDEYDALIHFLKGENIQSLDLVIITHWHEDHYGELVDLEREFSIGRCVAGSLGPVIYSSDLTIVRQGDELICHEFTFAFLSANRQSAEENNNSLVFTCQIGSDWWLFLGDAEAEVEKELLKRPDLKADIVKVAHHGSLTSSTQALVDTLGASYALIPVGKNGYGFPCDTILNRWTDANAKVLRTDQDGAIMFTYGFLRRPYIVTQSAGWVENLLNNLSVPKSISRLFTFR